MPVRAEKAISFKCELCGKLQFHPYSLELDVYDRKAVKADRIDCSSCRHTNYIYEEIKPSEDE